MNICYVGEFDFGINQCAATVRIINNCKSINNIDGFNVTILGYSNSKFIEFERFPIYNTKKGEWLISKLFYFIFRGLDFIFLLNKKISKTDVVVYYGSSSRILLPLIFYCRLKKIKLVVDTVEWYDYSHLPLGKWGPFSLDVHFSMTKLIPMADGVIAISSYLEEYYITKNLKTVRVPILVDENEIDCESSENVVFNPNYLHLIYAGYAGKKDLIFNVIKAVDLINKSRKVVEFHILGMTESDLIRVYEKPISDAIIVHGKMSREKVRIFLRGADFSVLYRPIERYAMAGFPTKFVESLSNGLPVLANLTSDLQWYLIDGFNGFISIDYSVESIKITIEKALKLKKEDWFTMRENAENSAKEYFGINNFSSKFQSFFENLD